MCILIKTQEVGIMCVNVVNENEIRYELWKPQYY